MKKFLISYVATFLLLAATHRITNTEYTLGEMAIGAFFGVLGARLIIMLVERKFKKKVRGFEVVTPEHRKHPNVNIQLPRRGEDGACASDIYSPVTLTLQPGEHQLIWIDVKVYMQKGEVCIANVRSNYGKVLVRLANTQGWIDQTYYNNISNDGNIGIYLSNEGTEPFTINEGDRIAQLMFTVFLLPDNDNPIHNKRTGSFGSTGK